MIYVILFPPSISSLYFRPPKSAAEGSFGIYMHMEKGGRSSLNLFYLRYFVKLAHVGHYTKAAEQLCITQPSLSHAIGQLETELGVPLFEKNGRNTVLTSFGEEFLNCAENALRTLDSGVESLKRSAQGAGTIRLGFLRVLGIQWLPSLARKFLETQKEIGRAHV